MKLFIKFLRYFISIILIGLFQNVTGNPIEEVRMCIKEVIYSYYMRGKNVQYYRKSSFFSPEDATRQNLNYLNCAHFTNYVYRDLINTTVSGYDIFSYSEQYIGKRPEVTAITKIIDDKNLEMKYYSPNEKNNYKTVINPDFKTLLSLLEIGDILMEPTHNLIVYDIIKDNEGNKIDAVLMHAMSGSGKTYIRTKVPRYYTPVPKGDEYKKEHYTIFLHGKLNTKFEEGVEEATINALNLSKYTVWANMSNPKYMQENYAILRPIQENNEGNAIFKYLETYSDYKSKYVDNDIIELTKKELDRIKFKHLYIEKLVDKNTGSVVEIGDFLIYTIIIKNYGKENYKEDLIVIENISQFVSYEKYESNSTDIKFEYDKKNRQLKWNIN